MKKVFLFSFLCLSFLLSGETLDIAIWTPDARNSFDRNQAFFNELTSRTGIEFNLIQMPLSRAVVELRKGRIDGNYNRSKLAYDDSDDIIFSKQPLNYIPFYIVTMDPSIDSQKMETYKDKELVIVQGTKAVESWIDRTNIENVTTVKDFFTVLEMIKLGRGDYTIGSKQFFPYLEKAEYSDFRILEPPIEQLTVHFILRKNLEDLMAVIDNALFEMEAEGLLDLYFIRE